MPLSKGQRQRRNRRLRKEASEKFDETLGPMQSHIREFLETQTGNIGAPSSDQTEPFERAPPHMVEWGEDPTLNEDMLERLSRKAADSRSAEREQTISDLKLKHHPIWNARGAAGKISRAEAKVGNPISERTVREYISSIRQK